MTWRQLAQRDGLTLGELWAFLAVALPVLAALLAPLPSVDLAYHLRAGESMLATGAIPATDTFTFTAAGRPWLDQQWAAEAILAGAYRLAGWTGIAVLRAVLVGAAFGLVFVAVRRRNPGLAQREAALLTLGAFVVAAAALGPRPQLFAIVLFAATVALLADRRTHPRRIWLIPMMVVAWANLHGSFFLAPLLVGLAWLEDVHDRAPRPTRTLAVAATSVVATLVNPFGAGVWSYGLGLLSNPEVTARLSEWQPTSLGDPAGVLFVVSVVGVALLLARRATVTPWPSLLAFGVFAAIGLAALRGIVWWALSAPVVVAGLLPPSPIQARVPRRSRMNTAIVAVLAIAAIGLQPVWRPLDPGLGAPRGVVAIAPAGITANLRTIVRAGDRLWNPQAWGSWFEFALPDATVAVDSRIELFPPDVWTDYDTVSDARAGWPAALDRWRVSLVVTEAGQLSLAEALAANAGWRRAYADGDGAVWVRSDRSSALAGRRVDSTGALGGS